MLKSFFTDLFNREVDTAPIFIIGCVRSGTTLLFQLLSQHPSLVATTGYPDGEDHEGWIEHGGALISGLGSPSVNDGHTGYHYCLAMDEHAADTQAIANMREYYAGIAREQKNARVLNKCPHLSNKLRYVKGIFPNALFIHIIRDCVPVVASIQKMMAEQPGQVVYWPNLPDGCLWVLPSPHQENREKVFANNPNITPGGGLFSLVNYWVNVNNNIERQLASENNVLLTIRYEDLCKEPEKMLQTITDFCRLPRFRDPPKPKNKRPIQHDRNEKHGNQFDAETLSKINEIADETRLAFGYSPTEKAW